MIGMAWARGLRQAQPERMLNRTKTPHPFSLSRSQAARVLRQARHERWFVWVNNPTPLSLVPEQARHCGMSYEDLVEAIIAEALDDAGPAKAGPA